MPTTSSNTALSLCQPIAAPAGYSVTKACGNRDGARPAKAAAASRSGSRKDGMSPARRSSPELKSYFQPMETTRRLPAWPRNPDAAKARPANWSRRSRSWSSAEYPAEV